MTGKIQRVAETSFWAVPVRTGTEATSAVRWVYVREYVDDAATIGRALQLADLPPHCTAAYAQALVEALLARAGRKAAVERVTVAGRDAVAVLARADVAETLCARAARRSSTAAEADALVLPPAALASVAAASGLGAWAAAARAACAVAEHPERLRAEADRVVRTFVAQRHAANVASEAAASAPDADGWVLVGARRGGAQRAAHTGGATVHAGPVAAARQKAAAARKRGHVQQQAAQRDMYQFGERRKGGQDAVDALRRRFEADRARVEKMKANRKFRPL